MLASPARAMLKIELGLRIRDSENPVSERPPPGPILGCGRGLACRTARLVPAGEVHGPILHRDRFATGCDTSVAGHQPRSECGTHGCPRAATVPPLPTRQDPKRSGQAKTDRFGDLGLRLRSGSADPRHSSGPRGSGPWGRGSRTRPERPPAIPPRKTQRAAPKP